MKKFAFLTLIIVLISAPAAISHPDDCHFDLLADLNLDCQVTIADFAIVAQLWLIDCKSDPFDPECYPLDFDDDGFDAISDCDDHDPNVNPGAAEVCNNGIDDDCDTFVDCDDPNCSTSCGNWWFYDHDGDGYGDPAVSLWSITQPVGYVANDDDCDDNDMYINPSEEETCDGIDNNCNDLVDDSLIQEQCALVMGVCSGAERVCGGAVGWLECDASNYGPDYEPFEVTCDGMDNDCDGAIDEGNPGGGAACDGIDSDLCAEGVYSCASGTMICDDESGSDLDVCDGLDNDCDPSSPDGSEDVLVGLSCDGGDSDLCYEGVNSCIGGTISCSDSTGDDLDICDGLDNDCDPTSNDGDEDPQVGASCDGADSDLCHEGTNSCAGGALVCSDSTGNTLDICDGVDNDCDPASNDGDEDPLMGTLCDGADSDLCLEGIINSCSGGALTCSDATGDDLDICDGIDNDCDPASNDGDEDPQVGSACDGPDADLCAEGINSCLGGAITCDDSTGDNPDLCNGVDDDCDPASADGDEDPQIGMPCDGADSDLCIEGTNSCLGGALSCSDNTGDDLDICDGFDNDCDPASSDGDEDPLEGSYCDTGLLGVCADGTQTCSGGGLICVQDTTASPENCVDLLDNDCDGRVEGADPDCAGPPPACWDWPYQCRGDADDMEQGNPMTGIKRIWTNDLSIFAAASDTVYPDFSYDPCADFDRDGDVDSNDEDTLTANWGKTTAQLTVCATGGAWPPSP